MRVLHLDSGRELRGGQWQVLRLIEGLAALGIESKLLARDKSPLFQSACARGWNVGALGLLKALDGRRYDLVHAHDARAHTLAAIIGGPPLVVSRRVAFPLKSRWKYGKAARYIAVSEAVKSVLIAGGVEERRITVVYDGVPLLEPGRGTAIVSPQKGAEMASEAARKAGEEIRISGDLETDLVHAGIFVYVTECEGLGSGVLLAMSAGVPVIASDVGGLREIIEHERNGLLVRNDAGAFAAAIGRLRAEPAFAARLGTAARQTVMQRFTSGRMAALTLEVYRQVLR